MEICNYLFMVVNIFKSIYKHYKYIKAIHFQTK